MDAVIALEYSAIHQACCCTLALLIPAWKFLASSSSRGCAQREREREGARRAPAFGGLSASELPSINRIGASALRCGRPAACCPHCLHSFGSTHQIRGCVKALPWSLGHQLLTLQPRTPGSGSQCTSCHGTNLLRLAWLCMQACTAQLSFTSTTHRHDKQCAARSRTHQRFRPAAPLLAMSQP